MHSAISKKRFDSATLKHLKLSMLSIAILYEVALKSQGLVNNGKKRRKLLRIRSIWKISKTG